MKKDVSALEKARSEYKPKLPASLSKGIKNLTLEKGAATSAVSDEEEIKEIFPNFYGMPVITFNSGNSDLPEQTLNVGVILSGGQAPGGHNVIAGLFDALKEADPNNKLYGFLGGPSGIMENKYIEITSELIDEYRNTGGFDIIGSGRTKLETEEHFMKARQTCQNLNISAIVVIGGDDSNTNAAVLGEFFAARGDDIRVIGVPKTIDGDLKNEAIETSFGFDTATKVYSELIGNIQRDANSAKKYWHFIKLMGRSASHIGLECALKTQPNIAIISEEVEKNKTSLNEIVDCICDLIAKRANAGKNFGIVLIPEGLVEFIPEMKALIASLNDELAHIEEDDIYTSLPGWDEKIAYVKGKLAHSAGEVFSSLPLEIQIQLLFDRDPHGNVQVSRIETEKLLIQMAEFKLCRMKEEGRYKGKFSAQAHFFGYEGRCAAPSNFDADYCYSLGYNAFALVRFGLSGYISSVKNLTASAEDWIAGGIPLTSMMNMEKRHGKFKPVIKKALVELDGEPFNKFKANRETWATEDLYLYPGPIQYFGPAEVADITAETLKLEKAKVKTSV